MKNITQPNWVPCENTKISSHACAATVLSALLSNLLQTCTSTAPISRSFAHQGNRSAQRACEEQDRTEVPSDAHLSTADCERPEETIRYDFRSAPTSLVPLTTSTTITAPLMTSELDVGELVTTTCEQFKIDPLAYHHDVPLPSAPPLPPRPSISKGLVALPNNDEFVFQIMCRNTRNLVLDSTCPDTVPHIVITPPEDCWDAYTILSQNRTHPQSTACLMVPQCYPSLLARMPPTPDDEASPQNFVGRESVEQSRLQQPRAVFSHSKFAQSVECSANERLIMYHVVAALQKHQCRSAAYRASDVAKLFRRRYDCPEFIQSLEKPFKWTDPAKPLLTICGRWPGNTVLDSICPATVPHIIITEPPVSENPWITWNNATNDPQDYGFGNHLVVPSRLVSFVNVYPHENEFFEDDVRAIADVDECVSPADTPAPGTPVLENHDESADALLRYSGYEEIPEDFIDDLGMGISACEGELENYTLCAATRPTCNIFAREGYDEDEDDDDDSLPPFDDWYLSIAERTNRPAVS